MKNLPLYKSDMLVIVDDDIFGWARHHRWFIRDRKVTRSCFCGIAGRYREKRLAREVLGNPKNGFIQHLNDNNLDCRRENLRLQKNNNFAQTKKVKQQKKQYPGVYKKSNGRYEIRIIINGRTIYAGDFKNPEWAAMVYSDLRRWYPKRSKRKVSK